MGAWIETSRCQGRTNPALVAPRVGAWIETNIKAKAEYVNESHPVWVRGLKLIGKQRKDTKARSHPVWVRGLKLLGACDFCYACCVAPRVGAWIETATRNNSTRFYQVAPRVGAWIETRIYSPPFVGLYVAPRVGAWIETS